MAVLDARNANEIFRMATDATVSYKAMLFNSPTKYNWQTKGADYLYATGTGIAVTAKGGPLKGTVNKLQIDLSHDDTARNNDIDITITGLRVLLPNLTSSPNDSYGGYYETPHASQFWKTILSGNDVIYAPLKVGATIFGDFVEVYNNGAHGGNDRMYAGLLGGQTLIGDALNVGDGMFGFGSLTGGNDTIVANNIRGTVTLIGDVKSVGLGWLAGGKDTLTGSNTRPDIIIGDAAGVTGEDGSGGAAGGNDIINGRGGADILIGDFSGSGPEASVYGGNDLIHGGTGNDAIYGDMIGFYDQLGLDASYGGNDRLYGDAGNDTIYGDVKVIYEGDFFDGNDLIYGGDGNDTLYGDSWAIPQLLYSSSQPTGNDTLDGGAGNDQLFGYHGNDVISGGIGDDSLHGGTGADRFVFKEAGLGASLDTIFDFEDNIDQIELGAGYGFANVAAVIAATTAVGNDAVISLGASGSIRLEGYLATHTINSLQDDILLV